MKSELKSKLDHRISGLMREHKVPGLSIGIVENNEITYLKGFGSRDLDKSLPMTPDTLMGIGSMSKSFVALAIMQLADQNRLSVEDPLSKYLVDLLPPALGEIQIKGALSHSSGLPELDGSVLPLSRAFKLPDSHIPMGSKTDYFNFLTEVPEYIRFKPGEHFFYNNDLYYLLSLVIEQVSDLSFTDYVTKNILRPLGMASSRYLTPGQTDDDRKDLEIMIGYMLDKKKHLEQFPLPISEFLQGPGGIFASAKDILIYLQMLLNDGVWHDQQIISKKALEAVFSPQISTPYGIGKNANYCFGWVSESDFLGLKILHHGGGLGVATSKMLICPEKQIGIVVLTNSTNEVPSLLSYGVLSLILGSDFEEPIPQLKAKLQLEPLLGKYEGYKGLSHAEVSIQEYTLKMKVMTQDGPMDLTLVPKDLSTLTFILPLITPESSPEIQFVVKEGSDDIFFTFDRYLFLKKG
ncbi:MAG: serine hydrolase [Promethearchaeota archaeon]